VTEFQKPSDKGRLTKKIRKRGKREKQFEKRGRIRREG